MFAQYKESEEAPIQKAIVLSRPDPAHANLQVFNHDQNGSELKLNVPIYVDGEIPTLPVCKIEEEHTLYAPGSDGIGIVTVASLNHEVQQLREIIVRLENAIKPRFIPEVSAGIGEVSTPKEPVAVSEELGRESEVGE